MAPFDVIFCGNPGVGKSTLLSSVSNLQFESGLSWGEGFTNELRFQESPHFPGTRFGDTPGLSDIKMAEKASEAITAAFTDAAQQGRSVKIFFVVTVESGRVRPDDLFTIKQVMGSIELPGGEKPGMNAFGLIVNKCTFLERSDFHSKGMGILHRAVGVPSETVPFTTSYVKFLPNHAEAVDADNKKVTFDRLMEWVFAFPGITIASAASIDVSSLEEKLKAAKEMHKKEMDDLEARLESKNKADREELERRFQESNQDLQRRLAAAEAKAAASGGGLLGAFVDLAKTVAVPIAKAIGNDADFEADFKKTVGKVKKVCEVVA